MKNLARVTVLASAALAGLARGEGAGEKLDAIVKQLQAEDEATRTKAATELDTLAQETAKLAKKERLELVSLLIERAAKNLPTEIRASLITHVGGLGDDVGLICLTLTDDAEPPVRDAVLTVITQNRTTPAGEFLVQRMKQAQGRKKNVYIKALGERGVTGCEKEIATCMEDPLNTDAACAALAKLGTKDAGEALQQFLSGKTDWTDPGAVAAIDALLTCAEKMMRPRVSLDGKEFDLVMTIEIRRKAKNLAVVRAPTYSLEVFSKLDSEKSTSAVRSIALRGKVSTLIELVNLADLKQSEASVKNELVNQVSEAFGGKDAARRKAVENALMENRNQESGFAVSIALSAIAEKYEAFPVEGKAAVLRLLAVNEIASKTYAAAVFKTLSAEETELRRAAVEATPQYCGAEAVSRLVELAATDKELQAAARASLAKLQDIAPTARSSNIEEYSKREGSVQKSLAMELSRKDAAYRIEAIHAMGAREKEESLKTLIHTIGYDKEPAVRAAAYEATGQLGKVEAIEALAKLLANAETDTDRTAGESVIRKLMAAGPERTGFEELATVILKATAPNRPALLRLLGRTGAPAALNLVSGFRGSEDEATRDAAFRTLCDWPNDSAFARMVEIAKSSAPENYRVLAVRGALRLAGQKDRKPQDIAKICDQVLPLARDAERGQAFALLGNTPDHNSLEVLERWMEKDAAAMAAAAKVGKALASLPDAGFSVESAMKKIVEKAPEGSDARNDAQEALKAMGK